MGPTIQTDKISHPHYYLVRKRASLFSAWAKVRENGLKSTSLQTRTEIKEFAKTAESTIPAIADRLRKRKFVFLSARGALLKKKGKTTKRPVVIAPVQSRIVQRAILDVIQDIPDIQKVLRAGFNFGGVEGEGFGVPAAVEKALSCAQECGYYIRTDIKSFFTAVPRAKALENISVHTKDEFFDALLRTATDTELADAENFGADIQLFPLGDIGVAQGSSLSPLLCNFLLKDFDTAFNCRGVTCIRYIDDFILFARDKSAAFKAFANALVMLKQLGLDAYDPNGSIQSEREKADHGPATAEFTFLGCGIRRDRVRPSDRNYRGLLAGVKKTFTEALAGLRDPKKAIINDLSYADIVNAAGNQVRGWGNTYSFCSDDQLMRNLDSELTALFDDFNGKVRKRLDRLSDINRRRYLGFFCLEDCRRDADDVGVRKLVAAFKAKEKTFPA